LGTDLTEDFYMILIRCACCACCACCAGTGLIPPSKVSLQTWSFLLTAGAVGNTLVTIAVSIVAVSNAEDHAKTALVVKGATNTMTSVVVALGWIWITTISTKQQCNVNVAQGQGPGFVLYGTVLSTATFGGLFAKLSGLAITAMGYLLSLQSAGQVNICELDDDEVEQLRRILEQHNGTCTAIVYNMSDI
jgi:hypothetical protein